MSELVGAALIGVGLLFVVAAGIGVVRLPDAFARMHAATKAGTLGATLMLLGTAIVLGDGWLAASFTVFVLLATLPLAAQMLGRAVYLSGTEMTPLTGPDPLRGELTPSAAARSDTATEDVPPR